MTEIIDIPRKKAQDVLDLLDSKNSKDYVLVPREVGKADLIIHGAPNGTVCYNDQNLEFSEIAPFIKSELNCQCNAITVVRVYCCYALNQKFYFDDNLWIIPACNNLRELKLRFSYNYRDYFCTVTYQD